MSISSITSSSINSLLSMDSASWAKKRFEGLDTDSSDGLDADEFGKVADRIGVSTDDIFAEYDANKDGSLDKSEEANVFAAYAPQNQGSVDSKDALQSLMDKAFQSIMSMMDKSQKPSSEENVFAELNAQNSEDDEESDSYQELLANLLQKATESYTNSGSSGTFQVNQTVNVFNMTA